MSRRKHLIQELQKDLPPLDEEHEVVRVVAPRGGNIVDVKRADGTRTLCIMPKKFNRTLWVKRDGFLLIELADGVPPLSNSNAQGEPPGGLNQGETPPPGSAPSSHCNQTLSTCHKDDTVQHKAEVNKDGFCSSDLLDSASGRVSASRLAGPKILGDQPKPMQNPCVASQPSSQVGQTEASPSPFAVAAGGGQRSQAQKSTVAQLSKAAASTAGAAALKSSQQPLMSKVLGTIVAVLYDDQIKQLKKMPGTWPPEFDCTNEAQQLQVNQEPDEDNDQNGTGHRDKSGSDSDDGLPPLEKNTNRRIIVHEDSSEDDDSDDC